jgi:hypothetical protein
MAVVENKMKNPVTVQNGAQAFNFGQRPDVGFSSLSLTPRFSEVYAVAYERKTVSTVFRTGEGFRK